MQPPLLVRAPREHCALLLCACGARARGYVRGFAPNTPPGNFTVLNRRASPYRAHRLFRTAPSGRCSGHWPRSPLALWTFHFHSKPCSRVSSSALRANIARFFMRPWPRGTGTLGGRCPPKTPCQEPEVPGPPTFTQLPRHSLTPPTTSANAQPIGIAAQIPTSPTTPANA